MVGAAIPDTGALGAAWGEVAMSKQEGKREGEGQRAEDEAAGSAAAAGTPAHGSLTGC